MKKTILFLLVMACSLFVPRLHAAEDYTPLTNAQLQQYYEQLAAQVQISRAHLEQVIKEQGDADKAAESLVAKMTLAQNFVGTPSLRSKAIREKLLEILSKETVTKQDLLSLQALVDSEKAKIKTWDAQQQQQQQQAPQAQPQPQAQ